MHPRAALLYALLQGGALTGAVAQSAPESPDAPIAVLTTAMYNDQANLKEPWDSAKAGLATQILRGRLQEELADQLRSFGVTDSAANSPEALELAGGVSCEVKVACALAVARGQGARWVVLTKVSKTSNLILASVRPIDSSGLRRNHP